MLEDNWRKEAEKDPLNMGDQLGQVVGIMVSLIPPLYIIALWMGDVGFFTPEFSEVDAIILLVPMVMGIFPSFIRIVFMRQNPARPLDAFNTALIVLSAIYFLNNFHFDMSQFSYPFPESLRFLVDWVDEGWARIFLIIGVFGGAVGAIWMSITYVKVRELLKGDA